MAKPKRKPGIAESRPAESPSAPSAARRSFSTLRNSDGRLGLTGYLLLNVVFDVFCVLQLLFIKTTLRETRGLYFFFGLLMAGFLVVSIYDYLYDRLVPDDDPV